MSDFIRGLEWYHHLGMFIGGATLLAGIGFFFGSPESSSKPGGSDLGLPRRGGPMMAGAMDDLDDDDENDYLMDPRNQGEVEEDEMDESHAIEQYLTSGFGTLQQLIQNQRFKEAEHHGRTMLGIVEKTMGRNNVNYGLVLFTLSRVYEAQGDWHKTEIFLKE